MSNCGNKKYIITETREPAENEFIFCNGYSDDEEKRRLWQYLEDKFDIAREDIPSHLISKDSSNNRMHGFRIIKLGENQGYHPYND
jgi:hypothetical protein|tara:strand:- start:529 stop:786 length:258 start_codon:yes stop_codon:yes gene_type:complete